MEIAAVTLFPRNDELLDDLILEYEKSSLTVIVLHYNKHYNFAR